MKRIMMTRAVKKRMCGVTANQTLTMNRDIPHVSAKFLRGYDQKPPSHQFLFAFLHPLAVAVRAVVQIRFASVERLAITALNFARTVL
jgi:hypothetical protein